MVRRRRPLSLTGMAADEWRIIVVRAWREGSHVRVRLLVDGDGRRSWVVSGTAEALAIFRALLEELAADGETPPTTLR